MDRRFRAQTAAAVLAAAAAAGPTAATVVPDGFVHEQIVGEPFGTSPVAFDFLPDGRFVLVELESGVVRIAAAGASSSDSIATIADVNADHPERGLLGVAVDPAWPARPLLYFHYTATDSSVHVAMREAQGDLTDPLGTSVTLADPFLLLAGISDVNGIHNAGTLRFAPDGTLLVSVGDDGLSCQPQNLDSPLGKILRLDVSGMPQPGPGPPPLADLVPPGNPFGGTGWRRLVWAWGLRNPFRFDVDAPTGDVFIGNVGSHLFEEIEVVPAASPGLNFGWPQFENTTPLECCGTCGQGNVFTFPIHAIPHPVGVISVIGGPVVRPVPSSPVSLPASYDGDYLYAEIFGGAISRIRETGGGWDFAPPAPGQPAPDVWASGFVGASELRLGPDGALWILSLGLSAADLPRGLHRIRVDPAAVAAPVPPPASAPRLAVEPNPARPGEVVTFRVRAAGAGPATVRVTDAAGRLVRRLAAPPGPGTGAIAWDGRDGRGRVAGAGVYLVRLDAGAASATAKLVRLR